MDHTCPTMCRIGVWAANSAKRWTVAQASSLRLRPRFNAFSARRPLRRLGRKPVQQQSRATPFRIATLLRPRLEACATASVLMPSAKVKIRNRDCLNQQWGLGLGGVNPYGLSVQSILSMKSIQSPPTAGRGGRMSSCQCFTSTASTGQTTLHMLQRTHFSSSTSCRS